MKERLSQAEARRIALSAQGFRQQPRDKSAGWARLASTIDEMHLLQIDSVNVLTRSHYLPLFSRLGAYDRATLDKRTLAKTGRTVFECWAHEASLVPLPLHPLMRWRHARARKGDGKYGGFDRFAREEKAFLAKTLAFIEKNGPVRAAEIPGAGQSAGGWWGWSKGKIAIECLFDHGHVTTAQRDNFERLYDVPERVIPQSILALPTPDEAEAFQQLMLMAAGALGIATGIDLRDYFRLPVAEARAALLALVASGKLVEVGVDGWAKPAYLLPEAKLPRKAGGQALLSPFDPLVWNRERAERLFNFHYRIEIYTPEAKRKFGYYVLPFLMGEEIVGRVCLKADREAGVLRANAIHAEEMADHATVAPALAEELARMAGWLGLEGVEAGKKGNLARALARQL
ncbi:MAG: YcaQ family DNA glycosylase [Alphaproteobacteria bacterium]|nr:YcaQ family DNA glycosylase [Alphaproteobacteria bacterium]